MIDTENLVQVAFVVRDLDKYLKNYSRLLGVELPEVHTLPPFDETGAVFKGKPMRASARLAYIEFKNISFEFIEPLGGPSVWQDYLDKHGEGVHHLAFETDSASEAKDQLDRAGYPTVQEGSYDEGYYTYHDAFGRLLVDLEILDETTVRDSDK